MTTSTTKTNKNSNATETHARIVSMNTQLSFAMTGNQKKYLEGLQKKYLITIDMTPIRTMVQASTKIKEILDAVKSGIVKERGAKMLPETKITNTDYDAQQDFDRQECSNFVELPVMLEIIEDEYCTICGHELNFGQCPLHYTEEHDIDCPCKECVIQRATEDLEGLQDRTWDTEDSNTYDGNFVQHMSQSDIDRCIKGMRAKEADMGKCTAEDFVDACFDFTGIDRTKL